MNFLILLVIFCSISSSLGCDCPERSLEQKFCDSDFAIKIFVKSREIEFETDLRYKIDFLEFYDKDNNPEVSSQLLKEFKLGDSIWSADYDPDCLSELKEGKNYTLTGKLEGVKAFTNKCEFGKESDSLSGEEKLFFSGGYKLKNCSEFGSVGNLININPMSPFAIHAGNYEEHENYDVNAVDEKEYDEEVG